MYEPLILTISFPLLPHSMNVKRWNFKGTQLVERTASEVSGMQSPGGKINWYILWKLFDTARSIPTMSDGVARKLLQDARG